MYRFVHKPKKGGISGPYLQFGSAWNCGVWGTLFGCSTVPGTVPTYLPDVLQDLWCWHCDVEPLLNLGGEWEGLLLCGRAEQIIISFKLPLGTIKVTDLCMKVDII